MPLSKTILLLHSNLGALHDRVRNKSQASIARLHDPVHLPNETTSQLRGNYEAKPFRRNIFLLFYTNCPTARLPQNLPWRSLRGKFISANPRSSAVEISWGVHPIVRAGQKRHFGVMTEVVLEIKNLTRRFGAFTAVDALTLSVNAGEVFGLLGSNGAGKTTTIKMLTTLLPPTSGEARVAGFSITTQAVGVRRAIGYVPQAVSVDGSLTGYENLLIFAKLYDLPHREQQARIAEALKFMNLTTDAKRLVGEYSGGMVRRLEIAQSTLHRPKVLFLDEPTVGLDPIARDAVWKHLVDMRANYGTTLFFTTHYLEEAESHCDRIAIMHLGKLGALGTCKELEASLGPGHTLNDVFTHYAGNAVDSGNNFRAVSAERATAERVG